MLYVILGLSFFHTQNIPAGLFKLQQKLAIVLFPIIFLGIKQLDFRLIFRIYFLSLSISLACCYFQAFQHMGLLPNSAFYYTNFSRWMHPSYYALHLLFATCYIMLSLLKFEIDNTIPYLLMFPMILFFSVGILNVQSKAGLLIFVLGIYSLAIAWVCKVKGMKIGGITLVISMLLVGLFLRSDYFPLSERIAQMQTAFNVGVTNAAESTGGHLQASITALKACKDNWLFGVGIGDESDVLQIFFKKTHYEYAAVHNLNCHNQYLQTWLASGIVGLLCLVYILLHPFFQLRKSLVLICFCILVGVNFLFESMLERQNGLFFFSFFYLLLLSRENKSVLNM